MKLFLLIISMFIFQNSFAKDVLLTRNNHCELKGEVNSKSMQSLKFCLADKVILRGFNKSPIYLVVNSGGGSVYAGLRFISYAKGIDNLHTVTIYAASMASGIVEALPGRRYGTENALTMFHRARGSFRGQFEDGEVETQLKLWKRIVRGMEQTNSNRIGITLKDYKKKVKDEWWIYGKDNVTKNTLDEIAQVKCSNRLVKEKRTVKVRTLFGTRETTVSACPIFN